MKRVNDKGYTVVEVLVASVLLSFVIFIGFQFIALLQQPRWTHKAKALEIAQNEMILTIQSLIRQQKEWFLSGEVLVQQDTVIQNIQVHRSILKSDHAYHIRIKTFDQIDSLELVSLQKICRATR